MTFQELIKLMDEMRYPPGEGTINTTFYHDQQFEDILNLYVRSQNDKVDEMLKQIEELKMEMQTRENIKELVLNEIDHIIDHAPNCGALAKHNIIKIFDQALTQA